MFIKYYSWGPHTTDRKAVFKYNQVITFLLRSHPPHWTLKVRLRLQPSHTRTARQQRTILRRGLDKHTEGEVSLELSHNKAVAAAIDARGQELDILGP